MTISPVGYMLKTEFFCSMKCLDGLPKDLKKKTQNTQPNLEFLSENLYLITL